MYEKERGDEIAPFFFYNAASYYWNKTLPSNTLPPR
ncbi:MAG: hypothetical protein POELPBGB_03362 [Bacteroidia bacterium]|nr:hypothetical protein [Bacteroidia bacterium]